VAQVLTGIPASTGIAVGTVHLLRWEVPDVPHRLVPEDQVPAELRRFHSAVDLAKSRLNQVRARVEAAAGREEAAIFDVQHSILEDADLLANVEEFIRQKLAAEKAFDLVMLEWRQRFARHSVAMLRERVRDLTDVHIRVLSLLLELPDHDPVALARGERAILVTHDLTPGLTVQLDREAIVGIATDAGTRTSHVAILARSLHLPAVVGLRTAASSLVGGERAILDGTNGTLAVDVTDEEIAQYRERARQEEVVEAELQRLADLESVSLDGVPVVLRANVDMPEEADAARRNGADGVGMMRTEFLVVGRATMPDEEEQYRAYRRVVEAFEGRPVVIRTFDIGGDKLPVGGFPAEPNPFLGWRAIRMCLDQPAIFRTQLRALLRAGVHGDLRIMLPLVVTVDEVRQCRVLIAESADELASRGVEFKRELPLGVMVETPAAAVAVDTLTPEVSFLSIGTNDLVQYTLAVDRGNANLANRFTPLHPAVLRLIRHVVEGGAAAALDVGVCGEMASQPLMAYALLGLGVRQLSVAPRSLPLVKRIVRSVNVREAEAAAAEALRLPTAAEAEAVLLQSLRAVIGDLAMHS
jgi:phosphotransferase system enzyme I (PtsI)